MPELTKASAAEYENILHGNMTPAVAAEYLRQGRIVLRTFGGVLKTIYDKPDIAERLYNFFVYEAGEPAGQSTRKKINNWVCEKHPPQSREDIFKIAFALKLDESSLNLLLGVADDFGIQFRDGKELVFAWFLRMGGSYRAATEFYESLPKYGPNEDISGAGMSRITHEIRYGLAKIGSPEELREFYLENAGYFGKTHVRAYYYFDSFLNQLISPSPRFSDAEEENYSVERVMEVYLSMRIPSGRRRDSYSLIQKLIKRNWPNATSVKNIKNRKEDVSRKLLLLLYIATENEGIGEDDFESYYDESLSLEQRIEDHWWTINAMLGDCGMVPLDPRNAFDWLILYAISADEDTPMSERLEQTIAYMFEDRADPPEI